jgi:O-antigen/teichoic acid export membrane protein
MSAGPWIDHRMSLRIVRNALFLFTLQVVEKGAAYVFLVYITRNFGTQVFGIYMTVVTVVAMASNIVDFGLYNLVVRNLAQERDGMATYLGGLVPLRAGLAMGSVGLIQLALWLFGYPEEVAILAGIASLGLLVGVPSDLLSAGLAATEEIHVISLCGIVGRLLTTGLSILALHLGLGLRGVFAGWLAVGVVSFLLISTSARRMGIEMRLRMDWRFLRQTVRDVLPFALLAVAGMAASLDILLLARWHGPETAGLYSAARRPLEMLLFIPGSFIGALYPMLAAQYATSLDLLWQTYRGSLYFLTCLAAPLLAGIAMLHDRIVLLLFGPLFLPAGEAMFYLGFALALAIVSAPGMQLVFSAHRTSQFVPFALGNAVVSVLLNFALIPAFGIIGASVTTVLSVLGGFLIHWWFMQRIFGRTPSPLSLCARPLLASATMVGSLWMCWSVWTPALIGMATYGSALLALHGGRLRGILEVGRG